MVTRLSRIPFAVALYLDEAYPDYPTLFSGEGEAMNRFIERWSRLDLHGGLGRAVTAA
jgi:hypothetical protein